MKIDSMQHLINANLHFLDQAECLLGGVADHQYARPVDNFYSSTLGQHFRHCLDHYASFLNGMRSARIDYDARERAEDLEISTDYAIQEITRIRAQLIELGRSEPPVELLVKVDCGTQTDEYQPSTPGRELQFLVSHTVHHFAMIGGMCCCLGIGMEPDFGVAPSTLRHRETASID